MPIAGPLTVAAFYDAGLARVSRKIKFGAFGTGSIDVIHSTNNAIRSSTGMEVQFVLPVVSAPFRLIFSYNPQSDVKFTVGRSF